MTSLKDEPINEPILESSADRIVRGLGLRVAQSYRDGSEGFADNRGNAKETFDFVIVAGA